MLLSLLSQVPEELLKLNEQTGAYGLTLTALQAGMLIEHQNQALAASNRTDFCGGILPELIQAFSDSPYILQESWADTLCELTNLFYTAKNETHDTVGDNVLIKTMATLFNEKAHGSLPLLSDMLLHPEVKNDDALF